MKLLDNRGVAHECRIGLQDKDGAFFLLLDSKEPCEYFRFSDQADALTKMYARQQALKKQLAEYENPEFWQAKNGLVKQAVAARLLGTTTRTVTSLLDSGALRATMVGSNRYVSLSAIEHYQRFREAELRRTGETII